MIAHTLIAHHAVMVRNRQVVEFSGDERKDIATALLSSFRQPSLQLGDPLLQVVVSDRRRLHFLSQFGKALVELASQLSQVSAGVYQHPFNPFHPIAEMPEPEINVLFQSP